MSKQNNFFEYVGSKARDSHTAFMLKYGLHLNKIVADNDLILAGNMSKMKLILSIFQREQVLDKVSLIDEIYPKFVISKNNFPTKIFIYLDNNSILMRSSNFHIETGWKNPLYEIFYAVEHEYAWEDIVDKMLLFIYKIIYQREEVVEKMLNI